MKYLWFGVCISDEGREEIVKNGGKLLSAEVASSALLKGFEEHNVFFDTINTYNLPTYPAYPQKKIEGYRWNRTDQTEDVSVGYKNVKYFNILSKTKSIKKAAKEWAKKHKDEEVTVFVYSMHSPFMAGACEVKKVIPNAKIIQLIPDLPQYMDLQMSTVKKILKKIDWLGIKRKMKKIDKYVLWSKHMADFLKLKDGIWTVMEGAFDVSLLLEEENANENETLSIMYSGVLDRRYGVPELLDAMSLINENVELWFTGAGNAVSLIEERAKTDSRIKLLGFLPSRKDLLLKQREATALISTRKPSEVASKYCFPSKLFEYMVSGNPTISTEIEGIPEEYDEYLVKIKGDTPEAIALAIKFVIDMPKDERIAFGKRAKEFILNEKNAVAQTKKILDFIR